MYIFLLFLLILASFVVLIFIRPLKISFLLDTDKLDMQALVRWDTTISIGARMIDGRLFITIRLFGKKIYAGYKKSRKPKSLKHVFESLSLSDTHVKIAWGFSEPYLTGIFCAAADFAGALIKAADIELEPDFIPNSEYIKLKASTRMNIGKTLVNMSKTKFNS